MHFWFMISGGLQNKKSFESTSRFRPGWINPNMVRDIISFPSWLKANGEIQMLIHDESRHCSRPPLVSELAHKCKGNVEIFSCRTGVCFPSDCQ